MGKKMAGAIVLLTGCLGGALIDFEEGEWVVTNTEYTTNECEFSVSTGEVTFDITKVDMDDVSVVWGDDTLDCIDLGDGIECEPESIVTDINDISQDDMDAVVTNELTVSIEFIDAVTGTISVSQDFTCVGEDCEYVEVGGEDGNTLASIPCQSTSTSDIAKK